MKHVVKFVNRLWGKMCIFDEPVNRRGTYSAKWDYIKSDLLPMWVADMDFRAPPAVLKALEERAKHGVFGYSFHDKLPGIIGKWILDEFSLTVDENWIVLLPAIIPAFRAASHLRGGSVMLQTPNYTGLLQAPLAAGKETILSLLKNTNEFYEMDYEDMQNRIQSDARLFYLCNPHNPVGRVYRKDELLEMSRFAKKNNLIVISDEVHCGLVYDRPHIPYFSVDDYSMQNSITITGPAKTFNIPGLPFGFAIIPNEKLREEFKKICYTLPETGIFNLTAAAAAYGESREWKNELVDYLRTNRDYIETRLKKIFPEAKLTHAEGTYLQWIDLRPAGINEPFQWLVDNPKIFASDGKIYGAPGYVRFNFGTTMARLTEAMDRIEECVGLP